MKKVLKIILWSSVAGHLCYICETAKAQKVDAEKIYKKVTGSVLTLYSHDALCNNIGQGSGVVIDKKGLVITNFHLIQGGQHIIVKHEDSIIRDVVILGFDIQKDMMLLKISEKTFGAVTMANSDKVQVGEKVFSVGSPKGYENTITEGIVSGIRKSDDNSMSYIQVSCPLSPGSSGGAIVNVKGELIGISTYVSVSATNAQNLNFAIPVNAFDELINQDHEDKSIKANYYLQMGIYEFNRGQYKVSINYFKKVTIFEPQNIEAFIYLGYAYYQTGNSELMLHYLTAAMENNQQISRIVDSIMAVTEIYKYLADIYYNRLNDDKAIKFYEKYIVNSNTEDVSVYIKLAVSYANNGNYELALKYAKKGFALDTLNPDALLSLSSIYWQYSRSDKEEDIVMDIMRAVPRENAVPGIIYRNLVITDERERQLDNAIYYGNKLATLYPNDQYCYRILGLAWFAKGNYDKSIESYKKLLIMNPDNGYAYGYLSAAYEALGDSTNFRYYKQLSEGYSSESQSKSRHSKLEIRNSKFETRKLRPDSSESPRLEQGSSESGLSECTIKLGGSYYYEQMFVYSGQPFLSFKDWNEEFIDINFDIYNSNGYLIALVEKGVVKEVYKGQFQTIFTKQQYMLVEKATQMVLCHIKKEITNGKCQYLMWGTMNLPTKKLFQFTPEATNSTFLNNMKGAIFKKNSSIDVSLF